MPQSPPSKTFRVLFAGYAQVHFVSFLPIYQRLKDDPRVEIWFTGGFRAKHGRGFRYVLDGFYDPFDVPAERIIPYSVARKRTYHILFCSHLSQTLSPRRADVRMQLFHGVSFKNCAVGPKALKYDYLLVAGPYMRRRFTELELFAPDDPRLVLTGFAKVDRLVDGSLDRAATLRRLGLSPARKTVLFAPTGHKHNALELYGDEVVRSLAEDGRYNLIVKPHDHPKDTSYDWPALLRKYEGDSMRAVFEPDIVPLLHAADLLITDASSVANEYALLDRPIVFLDVPKLLRRLREKGVPLDLDTWGRKGGVTLEDASRLVPTIAGLLDGDLDRGSEVRRELARDIFFDAGGATDRALAAIDEVLANLAAGRGSSGPVRLSLSAPADPPAASTKPRAVSVR